MPPRLLNAIMYVLRAAVVICVVGWIVDIPGRLQIGLFTEEVLVAVLGLSLALTFLTFPLNYGETGEEAVAQVRLRAARLGLADAPVQLAAQTSVEDITADILSEAAVPDIAAAGPCLQADQFDHVRDLRKHEAI